MLLKRLELRGFKSFADPTIFEFESGITAIVGANGSGKSNVADAIRWALGEQSLKTLRGKRTEDVIFAGSSQRSSLGMAEVSLTFDNSGQRFDLPYSEVVLTRRAYRSGESEYLINRERVRWRDFTDLLQKANISSNGYTIIGQGLVDMALSLKADERRELLEEAAEVKRYRTQLAEAREKLLTTKQNILRANDVIAEIVPRLAHLETQARQLEQHQKLSAQLRTLQQQWFAYQWNRVISRLDEAKKTEKQARALVLSLQSDQARQAELLQTLAAERHRLDALIKRHQAARAEASARREEARQAAAIQRERHQTATRRSQELQAELAAIEAEHCTEQGHLTALQERLSALLAEERDTAQRLSGLEHRLTACREQRRSLSTALERAQQEAFESATRLAELRNRLTSLHERREETKNDAAKQSKLMTEGSQRLDACSVALERAQQRERELLAAAADLERQGASVRAEIENRRARQRSLLAQQADLKAQLAQLKTRLDVLSKLQASRAGYYAGVKAVLDAADSRHRPQLTGVLGIVAALIRAPAELEIAVDVALGSHAQDIVVSHWEDAQAAIEFLKRSEAGRATFLPLDVLSRTIKPTTDSQQRAGERKHLVSHNWPPPDRRGVVGIAADLVSYEPQMAPAIWYLLGHVLVVDALSTARLVLDSCPPGWLIVTLGGELLRPSGAITGGSRDKRGSVGLLARERELREIPKAIAKLEGSLSSLARTIDDERRGEDALAGRLVELERESADIKRQADNIARESSALQREIARIEREISLYRAAQSRLEAELRALADRESIIVSELAASEKADAEHAKRIAAVRLELSKAETAELEASADLNAVTQEAAHCQGQIKSARELLEARQVRLADLEDQLVTKRQSLTEMQERMAAAQEMQANLESELSRCDERLQAIDSELGETYDSLEALAAQEENARRAQDELRRQMTDAEAALRKASLDASKWREEADRLRQQLTADDSGWSEALIAQAPSQLILPLARRGDEPVSPQPLLDPQEIKRQIDETKSRLRALGDVNPQAIAEYEEVKARHAFLVNQALDLERASVALQRIIVELERAAKQRFDETFACVSREFSRYFVELFGGGSARLALNHDNNDEVPGIDIIAQPPGKRPQSLSLLSGGERALTATALIFAILEAVPTPFSVFDEVDAALDDANVDRFCRALSRLSQRTQFIVITHNRGTMDAAETIYGISMSESNTSRVLSLRIPPPHHLQAELSQRS